MCDDQQHDEPTRDEKRRKTTGDGIVDTIKLGVALHKERELRKRVEDVSGLDSDTLDRLGGLPTREGYDPCRACGQTHGEECEQWGYDNGWRDGDRAATERIVAWLRAEAEVAEDVDTYNSVQAAATMRYRADCIEREEHE